VLLPALRPQLIALDMDGTICDSTNTIPPENLAALCACRRAGIHLVVLTGRRRSTLASVLETLYQACEGAAGGSWFVSTNSGGLVWEYPGWRQHSVRTMPPALARRVLALLAPHSLNCYVNPAASGGTELVHLRRAPSTAFDLYFSRFGAGTRQTESESELLAHEITQFAVPGDDATVFALAGLLRRHFPPEELSVLTMRWPLLGLRGLEAYSPACNKASALEGIAGWLGVAQERTAAAGDDQNDKPMLAWAGASAAMPHAPADVAAAAQQRLPGEDVAALAPWLEALAGLPADWPQRP
jgi:hydroxymethylpyrimidine pyrophosphatase-like HAD family hydrolase